MIMQTARILALLSAPLMRSAKSLSDPPAPDAWFTRAAIVAVAQGSDRKAAVEALAAWRQRRED